jgi:hypothetical protein
MTYAGGVMTVRRSSLSAAALAMLVALAATVLGLATVLAAGPAGAATGKGELYVVHGITGQTLDVYVDGKLVQADAAPKSIIGPVALAAGSHAVTLKAAGKTVASGRVGLTAGESVDVVAHLRSDASMGAEITAFRNDTSAVPAGKLRLAVAHVAAAPPADIKINDDTLFSNVAAGETLTTTVPAGTYKVEVVPAATAGKAILGPVDLKVKKGTLTRVYAVGDVAKGTMDAIVHVLPVKTAAAGADPRSVPTGNGGQAATQFAGDHSRTTDVLMASGLGLLLLAGTGGAIRGWRRRRPSRHYFA